MATLEIKLKQHTPMWHFQWNQPGCALRVTELKPKLDKFLIQKLGGRNKVPDNYWVDPQKKYDEDFYALDYKVNIIPLGEPSDFSKTKFNLFFANMGEDNNKKYPIYYNEGLYCRFFSLNEKLINEIGKHLDAFFATTNFGNRQSKGFGSFLLENKNDLNQSGASYKFTINVPREIRKKDKYVHIKPLSADYFQELFKKLETFYKALRSGDTRTNNKGGIKQESMLEKYVTEEFDERWDKKTFQELLSGQVPEERFLYRDLLGFSPTIEYKQGPYPKGSKIEKTSHEVERFKSPLMFKIIQKGQNRYNEYQFDVYLYLSEIPEEMRETIFTAKSSPTGHIKELSLDPDLSLQKYMKFVYEHKDHVGGSAGYIFKTLQKL